MPVDSESQLMPDKPQHGRNENHQHGDFENDEFDLEETIAELGQLVFGLVAQKNLLLRVPGAFRCLEISGGGH